MARIRAVLVRPEHRANIGAVARVITNTGLDGLDLVAPGDWRTLETWRTAWRAEDILEQARVFDTVEGALEDAVYVAGFAGRTGMRVTPITPRAMADEVAELDDDHPVALVFGPESHGLTEDELRLCHRRVFIPAHKRQPSLNLAQAVMVAGYEIYIRGSKETGRRDRAPHKDSEHALAKLERALVDVGFFTEDNVGPRFAEWRELFGRAGLTPREVHMVMALARKIGNAARIVNESTKP
jgi:TrmH family RNA methyltransferase